MYFQHINQTDTEAVFCQCQNAATTALAVGSPVCWAYNGTNDGVAVAYPATAILYHTAGIIADQSLAAGAYGRVQVYGHNANALVYGGTDVAIGDKLMCKNGVVYLIKDGGTLVAGESGVIVAGQAYTTASAAAKKVFIRCC